MFIAIDTPAGKFGTETTPDVAEMVRDRLLKAMVTAAEEGRDVPRLRVRGARPNGHSNVTLTEFEARLEALLESI